MPLDLILRLFKISQPTFISSTGSDAKGDFRFVTVFPTFAEMGEFRDAYEGSKVEEVDLQLNDIADCGNSSVWEGISTL